MSFFSFWGEKIVIFCLGHLSVGRVVNFGGYQRGGKRANGDSAHRTTKADIRCRGKEEKKRPHIDMRRIIATNGGKNATEWNNQHDMPDNKQNYIPAYNVGLIDIDAMLTHSEADERQAAYYSYFENLSPTKPLLTSPLIRSKCLNTGGVGFKS